MTYCDKNAQEENIKENKTGFYLLQTKQVVLIVQEHLSKVITDVVIYSFICILIDLTSILDSNGI